MTDRWHDDASGTDPSPGIHARVTVEPADDSPQATQAIEAMQREYGHVSADVIFHCDSPEFDGTVLRDVQVNIVSQDELDSDEYGYISFPDDEGYDDDEDGETDKAADDVTAAVQPLPWRAIVGMESVSRYAERVFRSVVVALEDLPGDQIDGISPLYHVSNLDGPDSMTAVARTRTNLSITDFTAALRSIEAELNEEDPVELHLVDIADVNDADGNVTESTDGDSAPGPDLGDPDEISKLWSPARQRASVLAPWLDMDPQATLRGDAVSYLLASAPDADRVGFLGDKWVLRGIV